MLGENFIDLEFFAKLLSLVLARLGNLDHNQRMDLVDEGDTPSPDPVYTRKLALYIHYQGRNRGENNKSV